jgi:oligoribonuclease (3'-5' exoribonuclease)
MAATIFGRLAESLDADLDGKSNGIGPMDQRIKNEYGKSGLTERSSNQFRRASCEPKISDPSKKMTLTIGSSFMNGKSIRQIAEFAN